MNIPRVTITGAIVGVTLSAWLGLLAPGAQAAGPTQAQSEPIGTLAVKEKVRYDDGARYAFISDHESPKVAVIDTFEHQLLEHLSLEVIPAALVVSDLSDLLVYSDYQTPTLYVFDLVTRKQWRIALDFTPQSLTFNPDGDRLAVAGKDQLQLIDPLAKKQYGSLAGFKGPISLNYTTDGYYLFISEINTGTVTRWNMSDNTKTQLQFGNGQAISELTLSPDSRIALAALKKDQQLLVWDLDANQPMTLLPLEGQPSRPYVSGTSEDIIITTLEGKVTVIDSWTGLLKRQLIVGNNPRQIRTGWLETIGVVESEGEINVFALNGNKAAKNFSIDGRLQDMVVVSDSKTLFATQTGATTLFVFDIRVIQAGAAIETGLKKPTLIAMGITNTACH